MKKWERNSPKIFFQIYGARIQKMLSKGNPVLLVNYKVKALNKEYEFGKGSLLYKESRSAKIKLYP